MNDYICTDINDPIYLEYLEKHAHWTASLSNGLTVYQDDGKFKGNDNAWVRMANYCRNNKVFIRNVILRFRQNEHHFPAQPLYILTKGAGAEILSGGETHNFLILGYPLFNHPHQIVNLWYRTPEMAMFRTHIEELKTLEEGDLAPAIIANPDFYEPVPK